MNLNHSNQKGGRFGERIGILTDYSKRVKNKLIDMKQLENTLQDLKCMLIEDGYVDDNIVMRTLIKAQQQVKCICDGKVCSLQKKKQTVKKLKETD